MKKVKYVNIKTILNNISEDVYFLENQNLINYFYGYKYMLVKRVSVDVVVNEVKKMIEDLKNTKITPLRNSRYLIEVGNYKCDFVGKDDTREIYLNLTKNKVKKLEKFLKRYK